MKSIKAIAKRLFLRKVCVLGDSHAGVFHYINSRIIANVWFDVKSVGGATAFGLANPNSKTNAMEIFKVKIEEVAKNVPLIFLLGEVDTGYLIWWRSQRKGTEIKDEFENSLKNYAAFLRWAKEQGFEDIIVLSATLPTIRNNAQEHGDIAGERKSVTASQEDRTRLTLKYNQNLKDICEKNGFHYIDLDGRMLNQNKQLIKKKYLNENPFDHHCNNKQYSKVILEELKKQGLVKWTISKP